MTTAIRDCDYGVSVPCAVIINAIVDDDWTEEPQLSVCSLEERERLRELAESIINGFIKLDALCLALPTRAAHFKKTHKYNAHRFMREITEILYAGEG